MISRFIEVICGFVPPRISAASPSSGRIAHLTPITSRIKRCFKPFGTLVAAPADDFDMDEHSCLLSLVFFFSCRSRYSAMTKSRCNRLVKPKLPGHSSFAVRGDHE